MIRVEDILRPPDFEARANQFIKEVEMRAHDYPRIVVVARNKTLRDLENGPSTIEWMQREYPEFTREEWIRDRNNEIESSFMNVVGVHLGADDKIDLFEFTRIIDRIAKALEARKQPIRPFKDYGENSGYTFRYDGELFYDFD